MGRAERRREGDVLPDGRGLRRVLRVHRRPGRPDRRLPRGVRSARQHDHLLLRRQRRVGRGLAERLGQRGQDLRRLPRRPRAEPDDGRPARQPEHVQPLPDGLGDGVLDAVPDVQALRVPGRRVRPAGDPLAGRDQPPRARCATSTTTPPTSCRRSYDVCGVEMPDVVQRRDAEPAVGRVDALLVRRRRRADRRSTPSTTRCSATAASGTTAGRRSPSTARWPARASSTTTAGSCSTPTRTAPRPTTSPTSTPTSSRS